MRKLICYPVVYSRNRHYWRVDAPGGSTGLVRATFPTKAKAEAFYRACKRELKKHKRVQFLSHRDKLVDAQEAYLLLEGVPGGKTKLRRAAALYRLCCDEHDGEAKSFTEPLSRGLELPPILFRAMRTLARAKGVDLNDLVSGVVWQYVRRESEKQVKEYPNEGRVRLSDVL